MTQETLKKAIQNRKEREDKLRQYEKVNRIFANTADTDTVIIDVGCGDKRIYPTGKEFKFLLRNMRDRLDAEINALDKEFESL